MIIIFFVMKIIHVLLVTVRPLELNLMFIGPDQPFKFVETMFLKIYKIMCLSHDCRQMASMYCWPSVSIMHGPRLIVGRKVINTEFEWTFGYLQMSIDGSFLSEQVTRVITSKNDQFIDPVHEVPLVHLCNYVSSTGLMCVTS